MCVARFSDRTVWWQARPRCSGYAHASEGRQIQSTNAFALTLRWWRGNGTIQPRAFVLLMNDSRFIFGLNDWGVAA